MTKNRVCKGCGRVLSTDPKSISYTNDLNNEYCLRCWNLRNYGKNTNEKLATKIANENVKNFKISEKDTVILINDILCINFDLIKKYCSYPHVIYVFNKLDTVLNRNNYEIIVKNIKNVLAQFEIKNPQIVLTSVKTNYGIKKLNDLVIHQPLKVKTFFIGDTNAGKSSLLNKLIYSNYKHKDKNELITSPYLNTSLDYKKIKINQHNVIDCPGFNYENNIVNTIQNSEIIPKLLKLKKPNSCFFLVKNNQSFILDKFGYITITPKENCSISFYLATNTIVTRCKPDKVEQSYKNLKSEIKNKKIKLVKNDITKLYQSTFIQINGLGHIYVKNAKNIELTTFENVKIDVLEGRIC